MQVFVQFVNVKMKRAAVEPPSSEQNDADLPPNTDEECVGVAHCEGCLQLTLVVFLFFKGAYLSFDSAALTNTITMRSTRT